MVKQPAPLLTIAIPTYNRCRELTILLEVLEPQIAGHMEIELIVSDNASPDNTSQVIRRFAERGMALRYIRHPENLGPDRNFLGCFEAARGRYFWICGDDDVILPGTIGKILGQIQSGQTVDLIYLTSYGFRQDYVAERKGDPLCRQVHAFSSARQYAKVVNIMFTFMSAMVVNRERLLQLSIEHPKNFVSTNLIHLSWVLPLLLDHRRSIVLWDRPLAARQGNAGGYALGKTFGTELQSIMTHLLIGRTDLQDLILNAMLRRWLPSVLYDMRAAGNVRIGLDTAEDDLCTAYRKNLRYWIFAWPIIRLPLRLAKIWLRLGSLLSMGIYVMTVPGFWRKRRLDTSNQDV